MLNSRWWQGSEQQRWDAAVLILCCVSSRETRPAFNHVYVKCAFSFGDAVISLSRDVKEPTAALLFSFPRKAFYVFSGVDLFHFYEKGTVDFVVVC